jgi:uncharacterized protein (DUF1330 family)
MFQKLFAVVAFVLALGFGAAMTLWGSKDDLKKGYIIAIVNVADQTKYAEYMKLSPSVIEHFGGRFVARAGATKVLEGPAVTGRVVIVEFPSVERAEQFYNSPEYQAARKLREGAATAQFILIEGS